MLVTPAHALSRNQTAKEKRNGPPPTPGETPASGKATPGRISVFSGRPSSALSVEGDNACSKFLLVVTGHARWEGGGRRYLLGPDTLLHVPAGQAPRHEDLPNDPVMFYVLQYRPELLAPELRDKLAAVGILPLDLASAGINQARVVRSIFQEMLFEEDAAQESWEMVLQSRLIDLAVRALRLAHRRCRYDVPVFEPGNESTDRVARYAVHLKSRFYRQESLEEAARAVGLSRRQFTRLFREVTGQNWCKYVLGLRLKHAAGLLVETDQPVLTVAFESGFQDMSHFHHCFKSAYGCSPLAYREQRQVVLPVKARTVAESLPAGQPAPGFKFRGLKGWFWTLEQFLAEIPNLAGLKLNFLMDCDGSIGSATSDQPLCDEWWLPLGDARRSAYRQVIQACQEEDLTFCFGLHPRRDSQRLLAGSPGSDLDAFCKHYLWAKQQGVKWFSIILDGASWGAAGPSVGGATQAALVNRVFERLEGESGDAHLLFCPVASWGDGTNPEHNAYLEALAKELHPDVYIFWHGDGVVTPRITRIAAESYKRTVQHRLFLWDNYPVNDGSPTMHLGPVSGREPDLCEVVDGYLSNPMHTQNESNRLPLATCADYAYNPGVYQPSRSIGQAILRLGKTSAQQKALKDLVQAYPGFLVAGGGTGTNPVREKFVSVLAARDSGPALEFVARFEELLTRLNQQFPRHFAPTRATVQNDIDWMKQRLTEMG